MVTIGSQAKSIFGANVVVKVGTDTLGIADRYRASWGYAVADKPVFGSQLPPQITQSFTGELVIEGLWSTDNTLHTSAQPSGGDLPSVTVTTEETDTTSPTPVKKTTTFVGRMPRFEKEGQADQFSIYRFTLKLSAVPTVA